MPPTTQEPPSYLNLREAEWCVGPKDEIWPHIAQVQMTQLFGGRKEENKATRDAHRPSVSTYCWVNERGWGGVKESVSMPDPKPIIPHSVLRQKDLCPIPTTQAAAQTPETEKPRTCIHTSCSVLTKTRINTDGPCSAVLMQSLVVVHDVELPHTVRVWGRWVWGV